jgi:hypothetical protein
MMMPKFEVTVTLKVTAKTAQAAQDVAIATVMYGTVETAHSVPPTGFKSWTVGPATPR